MQLNHETVCGIVLQARQLAAKQAGGEPALGDNPSDASGDAVAYSQVLQQGAGDSTESVLRAEIGALDAEQTDELVALLWIGRGDFEAEEFDAAKAEARERRAGDAADYLLGQPLLGDHVANALGALGRPCDF